MHACYVASYIYAGHRFDRLMRARTATCPTPNASILHVASSSTYVFTQWLSSTPINSHVVGSLNTAFASSSLFSSLSSPFASSLSSPFASTMSKLSLPSSPESVSDEDNQPKAWAWWDPKIEAEALGIDPSAKGKRKAKRNGKAKVESTSWVHNPDPDRVDNRSEEELNRLLNRLEKLEEKELAREEEAREKREEKALWRRIKKSRDREDDRMREANRLALQKQEMADRAAEWKK